MLATRPEGLALDSAHAADVMAFDRESVRSYDADGRLRVAKSNISKANICEYLGSEIPDHQSLGLDPGKRYRLLRHPDELKKAAASFNNLPILSRHVPVSADDHQPGLVIGATGSDADFDGTYLTNSLIFWARDAIDDIENEVKKELSSAYRYRADMTPGKHDGEPYDGVMRDLIGNHLAQVREGRVGSDVVVGDQALAGQSDGIVDKIIAAVRGVFNGPQEPLKAIGLDESPVTAEPDPAVGKIEENETMVIKKAGGARAKLLDFLKPRLAQDASLDDVTKMLDALEGNEEQGVDEDPADATKGVKAGTGEEDDDVEGFDEHPVVSYLRQHAPEHADTVAKMLDTKAAADEEGDDDKEMDGKAKKLDVQTRKNIAGDKPDFVSKKAMDGAIGAAVEAERQRSKDVRAAEQAVRPYVGNLAVAYDSAEGVYRAALTTLGVDVKGVHASALPTILKLQPLAGARSSTPRVAMDAAGDASGFAQRFPDATLIQHV